MKIEQFRMERTQCLHENEVEFNLSESGIAPLSIAELLPDPAARLDQPLKQLQAGTRKAGASA